MKIRIQQIKGKKVENIEFKLFFKKKKFIFR